MANYKRLAELIADNKGKLCHKLEGLTLPSNADEIKRLCIDYVEHLTRKDSEYMNQLSLLEQDLLSRLTKRTIRFRPNRHSAHLKSFTRF